MMSLYLSIAKLQNSLRVLTSRQSNPIVHMRGKTEEEEERRRKKKGTTGKI